jgi:hypothetical protein
MQCRDGAEEAEKPLNLKKFAFQRSRQGFDRSSEVQLCIPCFKS